MCKAQVIEQLVAITLSALGLDDLRGFVMHHWTQKRVACRPKASGTGNRTTLGKRIEIAMQIRKHQIGWGIRRHGVQPVHPGPKQHTQIRCPLFLITCMFFVQQSHVRHPIPIQ